MLHLLCNRRRITKKGIKASLKQAEKVGYTDIIEKMSREKTENELYYHPKCRTELFNGTVSEVSTPGRPPCTATIIPNPRTYQHLTPADHPDPQKPSKWHSFSGGILFHLRVVPLPGGPGERRAPSSPPDWTGRGSAQDRTRGLESLRRLNKPGTPARRKFPPSPNPLLSNSLQIRVFFPSFFSEAPLQTA